MARDHPRMRGEQAIRSCQVVLRRGSPPHARGTGRPRLSAPAGHGITPACAGNSSARSARASATWDHPRRRGEQYAAGSPVVGGTGSPPHARGTVPYLARYDNLTRITPACAGNRPHACSAATPTGDHPRTRGEQTRVQRDRPLPRGSPPHARGTETKSPGAVPEHGITPACAGNRSSRPRGAATARDHPRMRGEQVMPVAGVPQQQGSPRMCGEQPPTTNPFGSSRGSPPHARGTVRPRQP